VVVIMMGYTLKVYNLGFAEAEADCNASRAKLVRAVDAEKSKREAAVLDFERKLMELKPIKESVVTNTIREIEKPVYSECILPKTGSELIIVNVKELNAIRGEGKTDQSVLERLKARIKRD
jgi:hypothetical protein